MHYPFQWLYWSEYNPDDNKTDLKALKIERKKEYEPVEIASDIISFSLSGNGKKIIAIDRSTEENKEIIYKFTEKQTCIPLRLISVHDTAETK